MEKIKINNKLVGIEFNGLTCVIYKNQMHKDLLYNIDSMLNSLSEDTTILLELLYALIYTVENVEQISYVEWLRSIKNITDVVNKEAIGKIMKVIGDGMKTINSSDESTNTKKKKTK